MGSCWLRGEPSCRAGARVRGGVSAGVPGVVSAGVPAGVLSLAFLLLLELEQESFLGFLDFEK
jgi:hypothetical protein